MNQTTTETLRVTYGKFPQDFTAHLVKYRRFTPSRRCKRITIIGLAVVALYGLIVILDILQAFNHIRPTSPPSLMAYPPKDLHIRFPSNSVDGELPLKDTVQYCKRWCTYWNPAMIQYRSRILVALRESTRQQCGGISGFVSTLVTMAVTAISSIVYGELIILDERDTDGREKDFQVNILGRLRDDSRFDAGAYHQGMEDPRWLLHNDRLFLLTTAERGLPRLFLTELLDNGPGRPFGYPSNKPTVELVPQFEADYAQKNWMFVPADDALVSGANGDDQLLFVFRATPLHLVRVNPSDGKVYTVYQQTEEEYQSQRYSHNGTFKLSGSTHFIPLGQPVRDGQRHFLGVTHRNLPHAKVAGSELRKYESYFVRLTHYASENYWRLTALSREPIVLPSPQQPAISHRIHFISSLMDRGGDYYDLSYGYMDCTPHFISLPKRLVLEESLMDI